MMNVLFCANDKVYPGLELALYTLLTHNKNINVYIFTMNLGMKYNNGDIKEYDALNSWQINKIKKIVNYLDPKSNVCILDVYEDYSKHLLDSINSDTVFTPFASLRLLADIVLPDVDHILYLDCDVSIQENIEDMYMSCLSGEKEIYASYAAGANYGYGEMVSGIIVMKLDRLRKTKHFDQARELYRTVKYIYPDQSAIFDSLTEENIGRLPETYGYVMELEACGYMPAILHFTNKLTPKIYSSDSRYLDVRTFFYKRYPFLNYVKEGCEMLDNLILKV